MLDPYAATKSAITKVLAESPEKKRNLESRFRQAGRIVQLTLEIDPPLSSKPLIPTFDPGSLREPTPMMMARFDVAGRVCRFDDVWLVPSEMPAAMLREDVIATHHAHRDHWENSAPMLYPDSQLSLFSISPRIRGNITYLVWAGSGEPEVWKYNGMESARYGNLLEFFEWYLTSEPQ